MFRLRTRFEYFSTNELLKKMRWSPTAQSSGNRPTLWHYAEATAAQVPLYGEPNAEYRADKLCSRSELPIAKTVIEITTGLRRGDLAFTTAAPRSAVRRRGRGQATSSGLSFCFAVCEI